MTDLNQVPEPVKELLECLEIFMEHVEYHQAYREWIHDDVTLYDALADSEPGTQEHDRLNDEIAAHRSRHPVKTVDEEMLETAMVQVVELAMQLLSDHLELIDLFQAAADEARQHEEVGKIIRPALIVPGQA